MQSSWENENPKNETEWKLSLVNRIISDVRKVMSEMSDLPAQSEILDPYNIETAPAEMAASTLLWLLHQSTYLLKRPPPKTRRRLHRTPLQSPHQRPPPAV